LFRLFTQGRNDRWKERIGEKGRTGKPAAGYSGSTPSCAVTSNALMKTHSATHVAPMVRDDRFFPLTPAGRRPWPIAGHQRALQKRDGRNGG
jgi:hypothetical protein